MILTKNKHQPFEVVYSKKDGVYYVSVNKGNVHAYYKPDVVVEVIGAENELIKEYFEPLVLLPGQIIYVEVTLSEENIISDRTRGIPVYAQLKVGDELPDPILYEGAYYTVYYKICEANEFRVKQFICSDIWCGYLSTGLPVDSSSDSSSSSSPSEESSSSSSSSSSESSSEIPIPSDDPSSSSDEGQAAPTMQFDNADNTQYLILI